jgi:hypothetical protein
MIFLMDTGIECTDRMCQLGIEEAEKRQLSQINVCVLVDLEQSFTPGSM